ncbi:MAG: TM2 domain-containing membrane protein YozV [Cellvibrionaceae bacterium]|jgi:TM2 domain-containing membrane protein YozV
MLNVMKKTMKPVYFSALIFPGLGQLYLKSYIRGVLFSVVAVISFAIIMEATWSMMMVIANDIEQGRQRLDMNSLTLVIKESLTVYEDPTIIIAKIAFIASWIMSSLDAYVTIKRHPDSALSSPLK